MPLSLDPEFAAAMAPLAETFAARPSAPAGDVEGRRKGTAEGLAALSSMAPSFPNVARTKHEFRAMDGTTLVLHEFYKQDTKPSSPEKVVYYIHGGGMILGSVDMFAKSLERRVEETGIRIFGVSYRLAPEFPHPTPVEDCFAGLKFLSSNAERFVVDPKRIVLWGESAGGGLAAGVALIARDRKLEPPIRKQILIFPMIDDRNTRPIEHIEKLATWKSIDNSTGWNALLEGKAGSEGVSEYAAAARARDVSRLPSTYIEVGGLDIFVQEDVEFAARLLRAGVEVELHVYPGMPHAFQMMGGLTSTAKQAIRNAARAVEVV